MRFPTLVVMGGPMNEEELADAVNAAKDMENNNEVGEDGEFVKAIYRLDTGEKVYERK